MTVYLPDSVTEIPAGAFKGCTSLKKVVGKNIRSIGAKAFQGCTALESFTVSSNVESIGKQAFENAGTVTINAANAEVAAAAVGCGASSIILNLKDCSDPLENMTLTVPNTAKYFKLEGAGKTLTNVELVSDAEATELQNVVMNNTSGRPIVTSSASLTIGSSKISAPALAVVLLAEDTSLNAYGQSSIISNGEYAILSHNEAYSGTGGTDIAKFNVTGNIAVCGKVANEDIVKFESGKFVTIDEDEFEKLLNSTFTVSFDPNGGTVETESMAACVDTALGTLPVPTLAEHIFVGWFTEDGAEVTADTVFAAAKDIVLHAKWTEETINITLDPNGGTLAEDSVTAKVGKEIGTLPVPTLENYEFLGWYTQNGVKVTDTTVLTESGDIILTAKWIGKSYTVTLDAAGGELENPSISVIYGDAYGILPNPVFTGHKFLGWYTDATEGDPVTEDTVVALTENTTLYAHWEANPWSEWSTTKPTGDNIEIDTREVVKGYNMVYYCIKDAQYGNRVYRNYSIADHLAEWGASVQYGEHSFMTGSGTPTYYYDKGYIDSCGKIAPGAWLEYSMSGINAAEIDAYIVAYGNDTILAYIDSEVKEVQYRWREK